MKESTLRFYKERMARVLAYIQQQLDAPLSLEDLAERARISPFHFHHIFTGMMGETPMGHVRRLRLERAALRLKESQRPVIDIALEAGYETHEAFSRAFKSAFGIAPSLFRTRHNLAATAKAPSGVHYLQGYDLRHFKTTRLKPKTMKVTTQNFPATRVAYIRHVGPYNECCVAWERVCGLLGPAGDLAGAQFIGVSYDSPETTPASQLRYDACVTVDEKFQPFEDLKIMVIPGGEYARLTHVGPYQNLGTSYKYLLGQWLPRSGRELRPTPCFEIYLNSPDNTAPEDLLTDIYAPLEPLNR